MSLTFEWDEHKDRANRRKHRISFEEAATAFTDSRSSTVGDPDHSDDEERFVLLGLSYKGDLLVVIHTDRGNKIRIISARKATKQERGQYEKVQG